MIQRQGGQLPTQEGLTKFVQSSPNLACLLTKQSISFIGKKIQTRLSPLGTTKKTEQVSKGEKLYRFCQKRQRHIFYLKLTNRLKYTPLLSFITKAFMVLLSRTA